VAEEPTRPPGAPDNTPAAPQTPPPVRRRWVGRLWTSGKVLLALLVALTAAALVSVLTVDLGPELRARAEREGSRLLERPIHIGGLSIHLATGRFIVDDLTIEGLTPENEPFLRARQIAVSMPWWSIVRGELLIEEVTMDGWHMAIEVLPGNRHNFPKLPRPAPSDRPRRFVTTLRQFHGSNGHVQFRDHALPWSVDTGPLDLLISRSDQYRGTLRFEEGEIRIQQFEPIWARLDTTFVIEGSDLSLDRITLVSDGAVSDVTGYVNLANWPEQQYTIDSRVDFSRMRALFFAGQDFELSGTGGFRGVFALDRDFRELTGAFTSSQATLDAFAFRDLRGAVVWDPDRFEVVDGAASFEGGALDIGYRITGFGESTPPMQRLETTYRDVDLRTLTETVALDGMRLQGRASGRNVLEFPIGRFGERRGEGELQVDADPGVAMQGRELTGLPVPRRPAGELDRDAPLGLVQVAGEAVYTYDAQSIRLARGYAATPESYVEFAGDTAYGGVSAFDFHVTSRDWQQSDRLLAGIMTAAGSRTRPIEVGGNGVFDGRMSGSFANPVIAGVFAGDELRAWDVVWGRATGALHIENAYVDVRDAEMERDDGRMVVTGRFSLGFPRPDGGDEIDARIQVVAWPVVDLRHAFELDDYPLDGTLAGDFHVYGQYEALHGFGRLTVTDGVAYGEPFTRATSPLRFEGIGVRLEALQVAKSTGTVTGTASVGWDGTYAFAVEGQQIPVSDVVALTFEGFPLTGALQFAASGTGEFDDPRYDVRLTVDDVYVADEGIGHLSARLAVRDEQLLVQQFEVTSPRLALSGGGRVSLDDESDADLTFSFLETSLDPYLRVLSPSVSPYASMVGSGSARLQGPLSDRGRLRGDVRLDVLRARLLDYAITNDGPLRVVLDDQAVRVDRFRVVGEGTSIEVAGDVRLDTERVSLRMLGDANLGLLQGFLRDVRASGSTELQAEVSGPWADPLVTGSALMLNGRLRYGALPHSIEAVNGLVRFDTTGVTVDGVSGRLGGGPVQFGGRVNFEGLVPSSFNVTATGYEMRIRYPEGFRSIVDADLALRGPASQPTLSGTVDVRDAVLTRTIDTSGTGMFGMGGAAVPAIETADVAGYPLRLDLRVSAPSTFRIANNTTRLVSRADLTLRGTFDRPQLFGRAEIERGEVFFEGKRYTVTRGTIDFSNPTRIEPFFDIEAETRAQVPGQIYQIVFRISGTPDRFVFDLNSDPPLSPVDILALLFGDVRDPQNAELRALRAPNQTEQDLIAARAARLLASPISANVGRVAEQALGVDSVQITPSLGDVSSQQSSRLNPGARLTIGKRISERLYLSYTQLLTSTQRDQLILVEFTQSDRWSWIVSQNEDDTYALDVRVRHVF
jgi:hypothetical protein